MPSSTTRERRSSRKPAARRAPLGAGRLRVRFLRGSPEARGAQLGEALREELSADPSPLRFWASFVEHVVQGHLPETSDDAVRNVARTVERQLIAPVARSFSPRLKGALRGYAAALDGLDLGVENPRDLLVRTHAMYDGMNVLSGLPLGLRAPPGQLGCSSLVLLPSMTKSGALLHGRNFDLPPHGDDRPPLLCVHHPDDGIPHVSLHHGDGFTAGITATNQAGLTLGVHQNFTRQVSPEGASVIDVALEVIETCASLSEALELLRKRKTAGGWTFVLSEARRGRAAAVEIDAKGACTLFPPGRFLAVANCYRTRKERESFSFTGAWREHNWCRLSRLNQLARQNAGAHTPETVAAALGDHMDAYEPSRRRAYGNAISALHNLDAVVVAPTLDGLWIAVGRGPRNSADGYVGLRLSSLFDGRIEEAAPLPVELPADDGSSAEDFRRALDLHAQAGFELFTGGDPTRALDLLEEAATLDPREPLHRTLQGTLLLRDGFAADAAELFEGALDDETSPYRRGLLALLHGRALDVLGRRRDARARYAAVPKLAGDVDPNLLARAKRDSARGFSPKAAPRLMIDTILGDIPN